MQEDTWDSEPEEGGKKETESLNRICSTSARSPQRTVQFHPKTLQVRNSRWRSAALPPRVYVWLCVAKSVIVKVP